MTTDSPTAPTAPTAAFSPKAAAFTVISVLVVSIALTWTYLGMRAVMNVGGSCADGGPYVSANPCPDGSWLMSVAIPAMLIFAMAGTVSASMVGAPNLLVPMWGVLFGSLGWNFLEYSFKGPDVVWGWLVCGVMFWAMALPAFVLMAGLFRSLITKPTAGRTYLWPPAYGVLGAAGILFAWWSYTAIAS
jgi:hypothetical protein